MSVQMITKLDCSLLKSEIRIIAIGEYMFNRRTYGGIEFSDGHHVLGAKH